MRGAEATARKPGKTRLPGAAPGRPAASPALPFRGGRRGPEEWETRPTSCPGRAGRPRSPRPAPPARGAAGPQPRNRGGARLPRGREVPGGARHPRRPRPRARAPPAARGLSARGAGPERALRAECEPRAGRGLRPGAVTGGAAGGGRRKGAGLRSCWTLGRRARGRAGCGPAGRPGRGWRSSRGGS